MINIYVCETTAVMLVREYHIENMKDLDIYEKELRLTIHLLWILGLLICLSFSLMLIIYSGLINISFIFVLLFN